MTVHRKAPALEPADQAPALKTLAAWQHWQARDMRNRAAEQERSIEALREQRRQLEVHAPPYDSAGKVIRRIVDNLGGAHGEQIGRWPNLLTPDEVVAALRDLAQIKARRDEVTREIQSARSMLRSAHIGCGRLLQEIEDREIEDRVSP